MKISARNTLKGRIVQITKGATTAHVRIDTDAGAANLRHLDGAATERP